MLNVDAAAVTSNIFQFVIKSIISIFADNNFYILKKTRISQKLVLKLLLLLLNSLYFLKCFLNISVLHKLS